MYEAFNSLIIIVELSMFGLSIMIIHAPIYMMV